MVISIIAKANLEVNTLEGVIALIRYIQCDSRLNHKAP